MTCQTQDSIILVWTEVCIHVYLDQTKEYHMRFSGEEEGGFCDKIS